MKIDFKQVYQDRIVEIDAQIKMAVHKKYWGTKINLEREKYKILETLKVMKDDQCIK